VGYPVTEGVAAEWPHAEDRFTDETARETWLCDGAAPTVGHTHAVVDDTVDGVRLLNPGSATGAAPADRTTMMTAEVTDGDLSVALHER
jgi:predicted phosphodiesterase